MSLTFYQVDAFTDCLFKGNPAGVVIVDQAMSADTMQAIAAENNLAETAFVEKKGEDFSIRWFTPTVEVDLCGHATLASAHVLFSHVGYERERILFDSRSGVLEVTRRDKRLFMNFPALDYHQIDISQAVIDGVGIRPSKMLSSKLFHVAIFDDEDSIKSMQPKLSAIRTLESMGLIVTAPGLHADFVSRVFAPQSGIDEDPVTGAAHTILVPYWSNVLKKTFLKAEQLSERGGEILCEHCGDRVVLGGSAVTYLEGRINLPAT